MKLQYKNRLIIAGVVKPILEPQTNVNDLFILLCVLIVIILIVVGSFLIYLGGNDHERL